ncbi:hypothetical protein LshimejAT787_0110560 [Lyophyllum shimeji]|uniref:Uncharacterized protein n=1 Tax=Lyophyllum shimeji TaxID=47721 RepID=A0A9P3PEV9_LYOSH|nr:hypothetical protein LshimejAT787_0110560 [Lyophyllum shimeji]
MPLADIDSACCIRPIHIGPTGYGICLQDIPSLNASNVAALTEQISGDWSSSSRSGSRPLSIVSYAK